MSFLELTLPRAGGPAPMLPEGTGLQRERPPAAASIAATLYRVVGGAYAWRDRLSWRDADWEEAIHADATELWTLRAGGAIAGYFELHRAGSVVELEYFGLTPEFTGRGLGGPLLESAIVRATATGARLLTVNTCSLDHPAALPNYLSRGFTLVRRVAERRAST